MEYDASYIPDTALSEQQCECSQDECIKIGYQYMDVSVPIRLNPRTSLDKVEIECCGEPTVSCQESCCNNTVEAVVTQRVRVKFPIHYTVTACMGESVLDCSGYEEPIER